MASVEWPDHSALADAAAFKVVDYLNLATEAEIDSLKAERARLIKQCEAAGVDTDPNAPPTVVRALHPRAVVLPTLIGPCTSCVELKRAVKEATSARARTEYKYVVMRERYLEMVKMQEEYRHKFDRLGLLLDRAGVPILAHQPKKTEEVT